MFNFLGNFSLYESLQTFEENSRASKSIATITAKQVHDEIYMSGDELLRILKEQTSRQIVENKDLELQKRYNLLKSCGFMNHKDVISYEAEQKRLNKEKDAIGEKKEDLILIEEFYSTYPNYKIVHYDDLQKICRKYGLQDAPAKYYQGELPDKNLNEIHNFFMLEANKFSHIAMTSRVSGTLQIRENGSEISIEEWGRLKSIALDSVRDHNMRIYMNAEETYINDYRDYDDRDSRYALFRRELRICCLSKDLVKGWEHQEKLKELLVEDPIVYVRHGKFAIIVSAWGAESEDVRLL
jgi:hypothetical protein